ncbi:MAG: aminotransferase class I/II-fold pyridoxal phosphate-dependent enzyme [Hyphomicrobiales bacterium]|nr:aminotransferase class I/II-fold pyridoxal phosphate-dependent enzyme [Hyphomicrobiales bacterium]
MKKLGGRMINGDKNALLAIARAWGGERSSPRPARAAQGFDALPAYEKMQAQRAAAERAGVRNPFFRAHEGRAGALTVINGRECVNFASYDYLGLNHHPAVAEGARRALDRYGSSVSASRVVAGERPILRELEAALAAHHQTEDAVVFVSGHATNVHTVATIAGPNDLIVHDALIHNSVAVGATLSGAARRAFPHNDLDALERILRESRGAARNALIVVEGLYSMDGDAPDLARLVEIKERHGAWLMVDEAHSLGVLGATGRGLAEHAGVDPARVDIWMGTLSKTLASCGGYIAGSGALVDLLKFSAAGFVYSVGLAPPSAGAALAALQTLRAEPDRVARLADNGRYFVERAKSAGLDVGFAAGYAIAPVMVGDSLRAVKLAERMLERGYNALPIIYPAVPMQSARLRFFLMSTHTREQIDGAVTAAREELEALEKQNFGVSALAAFAIERM